MLSIVLLIVLVAATLYYYRRHDKDYWNKLEKFRGKAPWPIIGNIHQVSSNVDEIMNSLLRYWEDCGRKNFKIQLGLDTYIFLTCPECVELVLKHPVQVNRGKDFRLFKPIFGKGIFSLKGDLWKNRRKIISSCFQMKALESYVRKFDQHSRLLVDQLMEGEGQIVDICPIIKKSTLNSLCDVAMGQSKNDWTNYRKALEKLSDIIIGRFSSIKRFDLIFGLCRDRRLQEHCVQEINNIAENVIRKRIEEMKKNEETSYESDHKRIFLDELLVAKTPDGIPLTQEEIRDEVKSFIFAGHDTTSSAISFLIYLLSKHQDVQERVYAEQKEIFEKDLQRGVNLSDLNQMKYLENVIKESLRRYPSIPGFARVCSENTLLPDGTEIPVGVTIVIFTWAMGINPDVYPNPEVFDPDRFLDERMSYSYVPFSAGPRSCIGQKYAMLKIKTIVSTLLRRCTISYAGPEYDPKVLLKITLQSSNGIHVRMSRRL